jgi:hypothetical protein
VSFGSTTTFTIIAFGINGANTASPFDANSALPAKSTGSGTTQSVAVSTSNPNDYLIGAIAIKPVSGNAPNPTAGTGFTSIQSNNQGSVGGAAESKSVTDVQSGASVSFSTRTTSVTWAMIGDAVKGLGTSVIDDTGFSAPGAGTSFTVTDGQSVFLWSPIYPSATTIYKGSWLLDLWASSSASDVMRVLFVTIDSSNIITALAASGATGTITTSKSEVKTTFSGSQISVPSGGRLLAIITNSAGGAATFTIYWGTGQVTNYQTPSNFDYVLKIVNSATTSYSVSLSTSSSSSINRLTNLTVFIYSPNTNEIIIINGAFTLSSGPAKTLPSSSTLFIAVTARANAFGTSNIVLLMKFAPSTKPFAYDVIKLNVN